MTSRSLSLVLSLLTASAAAASPIWVAGPAAPASLTPRYGHAMAYDAARGRVVLFGGFDGGVQADTWEYDGTSWVAGTWGGAIGPRAFHAMTYDSGRQVVVLFGGSDGPNSYLADTWEYDGTGWVAGPAAPAGLLGREFSALAYDAPRTVSVLFGGSDGAELSDTWLYDGTAWTQGPAAPNGLDARVAHAMAFHAGRGTVVLFGGNSGGFDVNDTWEWDGSAWYGPMQAPAGMAGRSGHAMAHDSGRDQLVLHGGNDSGTNLDDTWELAATGGWVAGASAAASQSPRALHGLAYHASRGRVVLFGGGVGAAAFDDTWEYLPWGVDFLTGPGAGLGNPNRTRLFTASGLPTSVDFYPYGAGNWGTRVAAGNVDGGARPEILTGPGPGDVLGPQVRGFARDGTALAKVSFYAYATLRFGVNVTSGSVDADTFEEIVTGAGPGAIFGPHVRGFNYDGAGIGALANFSFFAYGTLKYGVNVNDGRMDGDGFNEIVTGAGPGAVFSPTVHGYDYDGVRIAAIATINFNAFATGTYGVNVAAGNVDADTFSELAAGAGSGPTLPASVAGFNHDGVAVAAIPGYAITPFTTAYGARPGMGDVTADGKADLLAAAGPDPAAPSNVRSYAFLGGVLTLLGNEFVPFPGVYGSSVDAGPYGY